MTSNIVLECMERLQGFADFAARTLSSRSSHSVDVLLTQSHSSNQAADTHRQSVSFAISSDPSRDAGFQYPLPQYPNQSTTTSYPSRCCPPSSGMQLMSSPDIDYSATLTLCETHKRPSSTSAHHANLDSRKQTNITTSMYPSIHKPGRLITSSRPHKKQKPAHSKEVSSMVIAPAAPRVMVACPQPDSEYTPNIGDVFSTTCPSSHLMTWTYSASIAFPLFITCSTCSIVYCSGCDSTVTGDTEQAMHLESCFSSLHVAQKELQPNPLTDDIDPLIIVNYIISRACFQRCPRCQTRLRKGEHTHNAIFCAVCGLSWCYCCQKTIYSSKRTYYSAMTIKPGDVAQMTPACDVDHPDIRDPSVLSNYWDPVCHFVNFWKRCENRPSGMAFQLPPYGRLRRQSERCPQQFKHLIKVNEFPTFVPRMSEEACTTEFHRHKIRMVCEEVVSRMEMLWQEDARSLGALIQFFKRFQPDERLGEQDYLLEGFLTSLETLHLAHCLEWQLDPDASPPDDTRIEWI